MADRSCTACWDRTALYDKATENSGEISLTVGGGGGVSRRRGRLCGVHLCAEAG